MSIENLPEGYRYAGGYVGLELPLLHISPEVEVDGERLVAKPEFHMSILSVKKYAPILAEKQGTSLEEAEEEILEESGRLLTEEPTSVSDFMDELRVAEEREKKTVIIMCKTNGTENFFVGMRKALGIEIPTQPFHVTLYTRPNGLGIGLTSAQELLEQTRSLTKAESGQVRSAINFQDLANELEHE
ncbi:MAG: hypothetical protein NUV80_03315 [Candidatus Berkelbacteria bacterium]|nr:hypothetical protein [Candidatus Berkelbacteria bacterium]MCR4307564.1 hypothetical protein [Candidatus Berkelbacteria bacterium]